jgi:hypothetical protein
MDAGRSPQTMRPVARWCWGCGAAPRRRASCQELFWEQLREGHSGSDTSASGAQTLTGAFIFAAGAPAPSCPQAVPR